MHIGTGIHEGKQIKEACTLSSRFLTIKEEIFTIVGTRVVGARVLDINDSNGMYGIEALSRGAKCAKFINPDISEAKLTSDNLASIGLDPAKMVVCDGAKEYLTSDDPECAGEEYDVGFFEIEKKEEMELLEHVLVRQSEIGVTVVSYPDSSEFILPDIPEGFKTVETRDCEDKKIAIILKNRE